MKGKVSPMGHIDPAQNGRGEKDEITITGTNTDSYHAIVLCGYDNVSAMLRIWNPWYNYYETIYSLNNYVPFEHQAYTFAYYATIYNWKRV